MAVSPKPRLFSVAEYARMIETGVLADGERVELIEGSILAMAAHDPAHSLRMGRLTSVLVLRYHASHSIRVQLPLTLGTHSEPEPDFALVKLADVEAADRHPTCADLVMELSSSSLRLDRTKKSSLYARAGIPEYWLLNLKGARLEVRRAPLPNSQAIYGWDYSHIQLLSPGQTAAALFDPDHPFTVEELLT